MRRCASHAARSAGSWSRRKRHTTPRSPDSSGTPALARHRSARTSTLLAIEAEDEEEGECEGEDEGDEDEEDEEEEDEEEEDDDGRGSPSAW